MCSKIKALLSFSKTNFICWGAIGTFVPFLGWAVEGLFLEANELKGLLLLKVFLNLGRAVRCLVNREESNMLIMQKQP